MEKKIKVQVNKIAAFIPLKAYLTLYGNPTTVFHCNSLDIPVKFKQAFQNEVLVYEPMNDKHCLYNINRVLVKEVVVRFKDIEDYTHYQTEIKFDESI